MSTKSQSSSPPNPYLSTIKQKTKRRRQILDFSSSQKRQQVLHTTKSNQKDKKQPFVFPYGNYAFYYGYRNKGEAQDPRLRLMQRAWFEGRKVLDIGCNSGILTIDVAIHFQPSQILGVDIDPSLVRKAERNVQLQYSTLKPPRKCNSAETESEDELQVGYFPISMPLLFGTIPLPGENCGFPGNITFRCTDWVENEDEDKEAFDVVLALSITKWIHLNKGDTGIKRFFKKAYSVLQPGGMFILEPQLWKTYAKRSKINQNMTDNYRRTQFYPYQFREYLLNEIGFREMRDLGRPETLSKGFQRPMELYIK
ncbi:uncharacterized protein VTP21DRAFT_10626 [Calcarisporiella thermophila]|uniref:uncharacterized protein n=1 Tax=Calcarisporiella thermophila TaxID=911321 RepID=UPI003742BD09